MVDLVKAFEEDISNRDHLLKSTIETARDAGKILMGFYNQAATDSSSLGIELKSDQSPVTKADKASSALIETRLAKLMPSISVMSEENEFTPEAGEPHWAIDPLDGTKLFIKRTGGFAINIALLLEGTPVLGVVYCPAFDTLYYSAIGTPSFKQIGTDAPQEIGARKPLKKGELSALFDQAHAVPEIYQAQRGELFAKRNLLLPKNPEIIRTLPSNLMVAEGLHDLHVKTGKDKTLMQSAGYVWDNAADYIILKNAGGAIVQIYDGRPLQFNQGRGRQPAYIAFGDKKHGETVFPELKNHCL